MTTPSFSEALRAGQRFLFDGSTPTVLYERGIYINRSFDETNLADPTLVRTIHQEFREAGAQILTTNTWGANRLKLHGYGLAEQLEAINRRGAELAREASDGAWVAGCIGPLGVRIEPWGPTSFDEARGYFLEQVRALLAGGVDLFVLESFADLNEINQAILAVREACDLPVAAMVTAGDDGQTLFGAHPEWYIRKLSEWGADLVGVNGGNGPASLLELLKYFCASTDRPIVLQPSAGLPKLVDGRLLYMASPEYLGEFARQAFTLGATALGGCSGTTPAHTRAMKGALRQELAFVQVSPGAAPAPVVSGREPVPRAQRSAFARKLVEGEFVFSVELVPPKGTVTDALLEKARVCKELGVDTINVPDGPRAMARMGAVATAVIIQQRVGMETVLHYACRDRNLLGMQSDLLGAAGLGLRNVLAITGDPPKMGPYPHATAVFDVDSIGLVNMLARFNTGLDLGGNPIGEPTSFSYGVGANPAAVDLEREKRRFHWKVDAGAEWAITQPVFDAESLFAFLEFAAPYRIPFLAGLWPLKSLRNAEFMAHEVPGVYVPPRILERMGRWTSQEDQLKEGLEIALELLREIRPAIQGLQLAAPMGNIELVEPILREARG